MRRTGTSVIIAGLILVNLAVFLQVGGHPLTGIDDHYYFSDNPYGMTGLTLRGVKWIFTTN